MVWFAFEVGNNVFCTGIIWKQKIVHIFYGLQKVISF